MKTLLPLLALIVASQFGQNCLAQAEIYNLTRAGRFSRPHPSQRGDTCHIFAAVSLFEEACERQTGREIKLSEAYLYLRHLQQKRSDLSRGENRDGVFWKSITTFDEGLAVHTLDRILAGKVLARNEFALFDEKMEKELREIVAAENVSFQSDYTDFTQGRINQAQALERQRVHTAKALSLVLQRLESGVRKHTTSNTRIQDCLANPPVLHEESNRTTTTDEIDELLSQNVPVLCNTTVIPSAAPSNRVGQNTYTHSMVVAGKRPAPNRPGQFEYLFVDPDNGALRWSWTTGCYSAAWFKVTRR